MQNIEMQNQQDDGLVIANKQFATRLLMGTGKFATPEQMTSAITAANSKLVTLSMRRIDLINKHDDILAPLLELGVSLLPNTSGAKNAKEAIFASHIAREALGTNWVKLEIHPDPKWLMPDPIETVKAAQTLVQEGFVVLPYCGADPVLCKRLEDVGCHAVMPLAAPIGSNAGLQTKAMLEIIIEQANVPIIIDAGIGSPSQATQAMEMGADAVLINTAIATAGNPMLMAKAFAWAVQVGMMTRLAKRGTVSKTAMPTSPLTGFLEA